QRELASPGVSYAYISRIEGGARRPSVKALRMLARKLGVTADYLEAGSELRDTDERELRIADAELELRLADDTADAERKLDSLLSDSVEAGDILAASRASIALGLASAHAGHNHDAIERLEAGLELADVSPSVRPDVYATLGRALAASGDTQRGLDHALAGQREGCRPPLRAGRAALRPERRAGRPRRPLRGAVEARGPVRRCRRGCPPRGGGRGGCFRRVPARAGRRAVGSRGGQ